MMWIGGEREREKRKREKREREDKMKKRWRDISLLFVSSTLGDYIFQPVVR